MKTDEGGIVVSDIQAKDSKECKWRFHFHQNVFLSSVLSQELPESIRHLKRNDMILENRRISLPVETNQLGSTQHTENIFFFKQWCGVFFLYTSYKSDKTNNLTLCTNKLSVELKIQSEAIQT